MADVVLRVTDNKTGYFGVACRPGKPKPYQAQVRHGGRMVHLGYFAVSITGKSAPRQAKAKRSQHALQAGPRKPRRKRQRIAGDDGAGGDDAVEEVEEVAAGAMAAIEVDALEVEAWSDGDDEVPFVEAVLISV